MSQEYAYLKRQPMTFYKELGFVGSIVPLDVVLRKYLKRFIEIRILVDAVTEEEIKAIFSK